jgi:hypothetical protein
MKFIIAKQRQLELMELLEEEKKRKLAQGQDASPKAEASK